MPGQAGKTRGSPGRWNIECFSGVGGKRRGKRRFRERARRVIIYTFAYIRCIINF